MNKHTEELRAALYKIEIHWIADKHICDEVVYNILSKLKELNYQKVIDTERISRATNQYDYYCEPIEVDYE